MLYVTGDMHGQIDASRFRFFANFMNKEDTLIVAGDFGYVWHGKLGDQNQLRKLSRVCKGTILFVAGNHENYHSLYEDYPINTFKGIRVHDIKDNIKHILPNQVFTLENTTILTFDGALSIDQEHRVVNKNWWAEEMPSQEDFDTFFDISFENKEKINYVITHEAPLNSKHCLLNWNSPIRVPKEYENTMNYVLQSVLNNLKPQDNFKQWYFGHYHDDSIAGAKTTCIYRTIEKLN